jgi:hypothetical protein
MTERETILNLIAELNRRIDEGTITPEEEEKFRDDIGGLQMNYILGTLDD